MLSLEEILSELERKTRFTRKQLFEKVKKKHEELSGLISLEGAAHLVARDLGISLSLPSKRTLKIKDLSQGMRKVNIKGRVVQISDIRNFEKIDGEKGRVCNLLLTDGTGEVRVPLWDKQVSLVEEGKIKEGDVIEVKNALAREGMFGIELRLPRLAMIEKIEDDGSIPSKPIGKIFKRIPIAEAKEGLYEIRGSIVQVFNVNPIFRTCPVCRLRVEKINEEYECPEHGKVKPESNLIISGIIDDGTASIRAVFFRDQAQVLTGLNPSVILGMSQEEALELIKENALGNEVIIKGRIKKNKIFDTLEIIANEVEELDIEKESKKLVEELESMLK